MTQTGWPTSRTSASGPFHPRPRGTQFPDLEDSVLNSKKLLSLAKNTNTGHFTWCNPEGSLGPGVRVGRAWNKSCPRAGLAQAYGELSPGSLRVLLGQEDAGPSLHCSLSGLRTPSAPPDFQMDPL